MKWKSLGCSFLFSSFHSLLCATLNAHYIPSWASLSSQCSFLCNGTINEPQVCCCVTSSRRPFNAFSCNSLGPDGRCYEMLFLYLQEVNKTLSYLRQCWDKDFGLSMDMAFHKRSHWVAENSLIKPDVPSRIGMSKRSVLIQDQSLLAVRFRSKSNWWRLHLPLHCWAMLSWCQRFVMFAKVLQDLKRRAECPHWDSTTVD